MTQYSYLWDGTVLGDATEAPYNKLEFNRYITGMHYALLGDDDTWIIPGYLDDLIPSGAGSGGGFQVSVGAGAAYVRGYLYFNSESISFPIDQVTAGFMRHDLIVLRAEETDQTVRLDIVKGTEVVDSGSLGDPSIEDYEVAIARIFVDDSNSYIDDKYVEDLRDFAFTHFSMLEYGRTEYNLIRNSEFMAFSGQGTTTPPEYWAVENSATFDVATILSPMSRGNAVDFTDGAISQTFRVNELYAPVFTVKGIFEGVNKDDVITIELSNRSGTVLKSLEYSFLADEEEKEFKFTVKDNPLSEYYTLTISVSGTIYLGQCIVVQGYHPGPFRQFHEVLPLREAIADANWTATAKSSGTTSIDLSADFNGYVPNQTKGVILSLQCNDSGSAGGNASLSAQGYAAPYNSIYGKVEISGLTNDIPRVRTCTVPVDQSTSVAQESVPRFRLVVVATGAGTLDATAQIVGILT